jgi:hypothetical protein
MPNSLRVLFAEQTTADEVVIFLLISVVGALILAMALYSLILGVLWRGRLRQVTTLRALLLPNRRQITRYLGEYLLAGATSVLLTFTVVARHAAVQFVLDYPLHSIDASDIRQAFPFGGVALHEMLGPEEQPSELAGTLAELAGRPAGQPGALGLTSLGVEALLLPTIAVGGPDKAALWLRGLVDRLEGNPWRRFPTERHLLTSAILLLLGYTAWFALSRSRKVAEAAGEVDTDYARIAARLLVPAVCVALLLVSAAGAADPQRVTRSAMAAAGLSLDESGAVAARYFGAAMSRQLVRGQLIRHLVDGGDSIPSTLGAIERLDSAVREVREGNSELELRGADAHLRLEALRDALALVNARIARDSVHAEAERARLDLRTMALEAEVAGLRGQLARSAAQAEEAIRLSRGAVQAIGSQESRLGTAEASLASLQTALQQFAARLPSTGLLLVVTSPSVPYQVLAAGTQGPARASGSGIGLHALEPGGYSVTSALGSASRTIAIGEATTVRLERIVTGPVETRSDAATIP